MSSVSIISIFASVLLWLITGGISIITIYKLYYKLYAFIDDRFSKLTALGLLQGMLLGPITTLMGFLMLCLVCLDRMIPIWIRFIQWLNSLIILNQDRHKEKTKTENTTENP